MDLTHFCDQELNRYIEVRREALRTGVWDLVAQAQHQFNPLALVRRHPVAAGLAGAALAAAAGVVLTRLLRRRTAPSTPAPADGGKKSIVGSALREMIRFALLTACRRVGAALAERAVDELRSRALRYGHGHGR